MPGSTGPVSSKLSDELVITSESVLDGFPVTAPLACPNPCQTYQITAIQKAKPRSVLVKNIIKLYFEVIIHNLVLFHCL
jgi:hypothetical protein